MGNYFTNEVREAQCNVIYSRAHNKGQNQNLNPIGLPSEKGKHLTTIHTISLLSYNRKVSREVQCDDTLKLGYNILKSELILFWLDLI